MGFPRPYRCEIERRVAGAQTIPVDVFEFVDRQPEEIRSPLLAYASNLTMSGAAAEKAPAEWAIRVAVESEPGYVAVLGSGQKARLPRLAVREAFETKVFVGADVLWNHNFSDFMKNRPVDRCGVVDRVRLGELPDGRLQLEAVANVFPSVECRQKLSERHRIGVRLFDLSPTFLGGNRYIGDVWQCSFHRVFSLDIVIRSAFGGRFVEPLTEGRR